MKPHSTAPVLLKAGKERPILFGNHLIFSGAIARWPSELKAGDLAPIESHEGQILGWAYWHPTNSVAGRILSFDTTDAETAVRRSLQSAVALRDELFSLGDTTTYRLVNSEGDRLPGLTVDQYDDVLVLQSTTTGIDRLMPVIVDELVALRHPRAILNKSTSRARRGEGLSPVTEWVHGKAVESVEVLERGLRFRVHPATGQKTGQFLDQREMRALVESLSLGKRVLNLFSYSGGFTLSALRGGATHVTSVDISEEANEQAKVNAALNDFSLEHTTWITSDVLAWLGTRHRIDAELIIVDPPAFAKTRAEVESALQGYRHLNQSVLAQAPVGSLVLTCSCSAVVDELSFFRAVNQAAHKAGRRLRLLHRHRMAMDHPINPSHPELEYLKSLLFEVMESKEPPTKPTKNEK